MAERNPTLSTHIETVINEINDAFNHLIQKINIRRQIILDELLNLSEEITNRKNKLEELNKTKINVQSVKDNKLKDICMSNINQQLTNLEILYEENFPIFEFSIETVELKIACFGGIIRKQGKFQDYSSVKPIKAVGKKGGQLGEIRYPNGVAFCEESQQIYIADGIHSCPCCIQIFTIEGIFITKLGEEILKSPCGVAVYKDNLYVTDTELHVVILFKLSECTVIKTVNNLSMLRGKLNHPCQLTVASNGDVYLADMNNDRIVVMNAILNYKHQLENDKIKKPIDIKIYDNSVFVLCYASDPQIQVLTLKGDYRYSLLSKQHAKWCWFFCIDIYGNIIISDYNDHNIKIINQEGVIRSIIGKSGTQKGQFHVPAGVATTNSGKLITLSHNDNFCLQIFQ